MQTTKAAVNDNANKTFFPNNYYLLLQEAILNN